MSLLELISQRSTCEASVFSLPNLLAEQAVVRLQSGAEKPVVDAPNLNLIIAESLANELLRDESADALRYADLLFQHGLSKHRFLTEVLPAAADALGRAWEEDRLTFTDVTHASGQLMEVARATMPPPPLDSMSHPQRQRALLARTPGEDHYIGLILAAQEMRRRGWSVRLELSGDPNVLKTAFSADEFDVIGFTIAGHGALPKLRETIKLARRKTSAENIVVGGWLAEQAPDDVLEAGADMAIGRSAVALEHLIQPVSIGLV